MNKLPLARSADIVVQGLGNETLIYDLNTQKAFCLNETSAMIWQLCDGKHSIQQISKSLSRKLKKPITEDLIWLALDQFKHDDLLERNEEFEINFGGLNRRQIIKKVGLASMVLLPLVSSLVAPPAASAQSLRPLFASCSTNSECASNFCTNAPPRCCVAGTAGTRGANVCCDGTTANCNPECCSNTGVISANPGCAGFGGFSIACPNS